MRLLQSRIVIGGHEAGDRNDRRRGFTQLGVKLAGEGESVEAARIGIPAWVRMYTNISRVGRSSSTTRTSRSLLTHEVS